MTAYEVFTACDLPQYDSFIVEADDLTDADYKGMDLVKERYPEGRNFAVEEIKEIH